MSALVLLALLAAPAPQTRVAVLDLELAPGAAVDQLFFSDKLRGAVEEKVPGAFVLPRETVAEALRALGKACAGACELEVGRKLGADYVVSGRIAQVGTRLSLTLRLHGTLEGRLVKSASALGKGVDELVDGSDAAIESVLKPLRASAGAGPSAGGSEPHPAPLAPVAAPLPAEAAAAPAPAPAAAAAPAPAPQAPAGSGSGDLLVEVNVEATCTAEGKTVRGRPGEPAWFELPEGPVQVACGAPDHEQTRETFQVAPGKATHATLALKRRAGGRVRRDEKSGLDFALIPAGSFTLGCEPQDKECADDERPPGEARVKAFWLGVTEVTVEAYARCVEAGSCKPTVRGADSAVSGTGDSCNLGNRPGHPINCVDWERAATFCAWLGGRLPAAEEWEYAAKGGESAVYPWGDASPGPARAQFSAAGTAPAGSHPAGQSRWGLQDLAGNVWEWTATLGNDGKQELRGGGWSSFPQALRASVRLQAKPREERPTFGVRCAVGAE